ncbi:AAA family ATPase [Streptomyces sp. NPDC020983]|uniref:helix-turn-helix transcriptional regulator n=1 Tax=Streptomyces sp. NPDC020983 TaxID=3365106 RepID=UPI003789D817
MMAEPGRRAVLPHPLHGRDAERALLADAVSGARAGRGTAVLLAGAPGTGRSALLAEAARAAAAEGASGTPGGTPPDAPAGAGSRAGAVTGGGPGPGDGTANGRAAPAPGAARLTVCRTACAESEALVPAAGLHRLLMPLGAWTQRLPAAQTRPLERVLAGRPPSARESFATGVALLRLLAAASAECPLLWCVDDAQWLDETSLRLLGFVARRSAALPVAFLLAADEGAAAERELDGAGVARLAPLDRAAALRVVADRCRAEPAPEAAAEAVDLAGGNPLALVELAAVLDGGGTPPLALPPGSRLRAHYRQRLAALTPGARAVVCLGLVGDRLQVRAALAAAARLGAGPEALDEALGSGLVTVDSGAVTVAGPPVRGCLSADLAFADRQAAHTALAGVLDRASARLPAAVHRLAAAERPSRRLAGELDAAAAAAREAGEPRAAASALERAAEVTVRTDARARWLVAAAADRLLAGESARARDLLRRVLPHGPAPATRALRMLVRGEMELREGVPARAYRDLSAAVTAFPPSQREPAARALMLAGEAGCLAGDFAGYFSLAERARRLRTDDDPPAVRLIHDHFAGMAATFRGNHDEASRSLRQVVRLAAAVREPEATCWASQAAYTLGDADRAHRLAVSSVQQAQELGAVSLVPGALVYQALSALMLDRYAAAETAALDGLRLAGSLGQRNLAVDHLAVLGLLAALQGDGTSAAVRLRTAAHEVASRELGRPSAFGCWVAACVDLVEDRPADALDRFRHMTAGAGQINLAIRGLAAPHFVEAAVRCGRHTKAAGALRGFEHWAVASGSTTRRALAHRCHGLLADGHAAAEEHFREALLLHAAGDTALERAKTELFFAHRLRRARRPGAARGLLREALGIFRQAGARAWAERATAELRAAGDSVGPLAPRGGTRATAELTAQQARICDLVAQGATNREIADLLVLSTRTVEYHLRNIFVRLGVRSRVELVSVIR